MKLLTKSQKTKLQKQYHTYAKEGMDQMVIAKIFDPTGFRTWYIMNQDPKDTDYLWGIVYGFEPEIDSISLSELQSVKGRAGLGLERDKYFTPMKAGELYEKLLNGEYV